MIDIRVAPACHEAGSPIARRARSRLGFDLAADALEGTGLGGDHSLDDGPRYKGRLRPAAVLVAIVIRPEEETVILTTRPSGMRDHSGQIAFPGGKIDAGDKTPCAAALREAWEEIGLQPGLADPVGYLDPYVTGTGFVVIPTVAFVDPAFTPKPDPREVADAFEVPLAFLMDPANHQRHQREIGDRIRQFYAMPFESRFIWGATAGIIKNLYDRLAV